MRGSLSIKVVGLSLSALFAVTYLLAFLYCVVAALVGPTWGMMPSSGMMANAMQATLPGFGWHVTGFVVGLLLTVVYGFYIAVVFVPIYNFLNRREARAPAARLDRLGGPAVAQCTPVRVGAGVIELTCARPSHASRLNRAGRSGYEVV